MRFQSNIEHPRRWIVIVVICIFLGILAHFTHSYDYYQHHFSKYVTIDGVKVGRLTTEEAYEKVAKQGANTVVLRDGKVQQVHRKNGHDSPITKGTVQAYFKRQHQSFGSKKHWYFAAESIGTEKSALKKLSAEKVTYEIAGHQYSLKPNDVAAAIYYYDNSYHFKDAEDCQDLVDEVNQQYATLHKTYDFNTPDNQNIKITNQSYGWKINEGKTKQAIFDAFSCDKGKVDGNLFLEGTGYNTYGTGYTSDNNGLSKNYVVVSLKQQKLWVYKDNKPVVTLNNVVTGTADKSKDDATPTGVWYIMYKQSPSVLKGKNDDGSPYASKVQYWMPFTLSGCGLHDASWRTDWSSQAYLEGGSHGCVNIKPEEIKSVWDNVEQNEPVVVYDN